jgi:hypothetical protein
MPTNIHDTIIGPQAQGFTPTNATEDSTTSLEREEDEEFGSIDLSRPRRILTVEFIHVGRRPPRVSELWEE